MLLLSHIWFAQKVLWSKEVDDLPAYYLWSIIPDIRYMNWSKRQDTHIAVDTVKQVLPDRSPSFLQWYTVHLLLDKRAAPYGLYTKARNQFPHFIASRLTGQMLNIFFELYFLSRFHKKQFTLSQIYTASLENIAITQDDFSLYIANIWRILETMSFADCIAMVKNNPMLAKNKKVQMYMNIGRVVMRVPYIKCYIVKKITPVMEKACDDFCLYIDSLS